MTKYQKGARLEYKLKRYFESEGCVVVRSAGSHGAADLVVVNPKEKSITMVQCKNKKLSSKQVLFETTTLRQTFGLDGKLASKVFLSVMVISKGGERGELRYDK